MPNPKGIYDEFHDLGSPLLYGGRDPYHAEFGSSEGPLEHEAAQIGSMNPASQAEGRFAVTSDQGPSGREMTVQKFKEPYGGDIGERNEVIHPASSAKPVGGEYHMTSGGKYMSSPYDVEQAKREGYSEIPPVNPDWNAPLGKETPFEREQRIKTSGM